MVERATRSDRGLGAALALGLVAAGGALLMALNPSGPLAGWGFAAAMLAGSLAVVASQLG